MNRIVKIGGFQFFCLIFMFETGTTALVSLSPRAKQDAWIAIILALVFGCLLFCVYVKLHEIYPDIPLTKYVQEIVGKYPGKLIALVYIIYFIYIAGRVLRDFEELLVMALFNASSLISIGILMMFLLMYGLYKGFETFARSNEVIFILIIIIIVIIIGFEFISKLYHINNLRPVLENGWEPIIKSAIPIGITFPFGEMITFTMIMPFLKKNEYAKKVGIPALVFSGLILVVFSLKNIMILGISVLERTNYPLLTAISYVNIANFVQRLDPFIVILMVCAGFVKIYIFFFCAVSGAADIFRIKKTANLIYPIGVIIVLISIWMAPNFLEHFKEGFDFVPFFLHIPIQIIIPIALLIIALIQRKQNAKDEQV